jgi:hypothetical protein
MVSVPGKTPMPAAAHDFSRTPRPTDLPANRLARETSPYLLQHAHNPVDWYPWGEEAFAKARAEDKPILLSVGYATWSLAKATRSSIHAFGIDWEDATGTRNGHFAPFVWAG